MYMYFQILPQFACTSFYLDLYIAFCYKVPCMPIRAVSTNYTHLHVNVYIANVIIEFTTMRHE